MHAPDQTASMYTDALGAIMHTPLTPALWLRLHKQPKLTGHFASTHQTKVTPPTNTTTTLQPNSLDTPNNNTLWSLGSTPILIKSISQYLQHYPDRHAAKTLDTGFKEGFKLLYAGPRLPIFSHNLVSANQYPDILQTKISKEVDEGRMAGPFLQPPMPNIHVSPIGLVPKSDGGWRMITHLSYPPSSSINTYIDPKDTTVTYTSFDTVVNTISKLGRGALLAKEDIKSAFRLIPVYPGDFELLGLFFRGAYYFDKMLPFGCSISCKIFETFSTFIEWLVRRQSGLETTHHYLDDFIFAGRSDTNHCRMLVDTFHSLCTDMGIPLNKDKAQGPTTSLVFLGLVIDTIHMQIRIPPPKIQEMLSILTHHIQKRTITINSLQSIVGKLNFFARAIPGSRAFNRRFYNAMIGKVQPYHHVNITSAMKLDMQMWLDLLTNFNGVVYFPDSEWSSQETLNLFTDSSGTASLGCGSYFQGQWAYLQWPSSWANKPIIHDITFLELVPIVLAFTIWAKALRNKKIILHIDNLALVHIINKQSSSSDRVMFLIRPLMLVTIKNNIQFKAQHIPGNQNGIADAISRQQWGRFRELAPAADQLPQPIPTSFHNVLLKMK